MIGPRFFYRQVAAIAKSIVRDSQNRLAYGSGAPAFAEQLWIQPDQVSHYLSILPSGVTNRNSSALVADFIKDGVVQSPLIGSPQIRSCYLHWCDGVPWEDTEDFINLKRVIEEKGGAVGCKNIKSLKNRFDNLDKIFQEIASSGRFKSQKELNKLNYREYGGVQIGFDPMCRPVLVRGAGYHRLAMARILGLKKIPVQIGLIDLGAIGSVVKYRTY